MNRLFSTEVFETRCRIEIEQSPEHFHALVEIADGVEMEPGDRVLIHGDPVMVGFGERRIFDRTATVRRAGLLRRAWTRFASNFELTELYEVSFTPGRLGSSARRAIFDRAQSIGRAS
jgi:hypothetical protein